MTSHMPPYHNWPTITRVFSTNSWNSKNVLKKVLQLTKVSFLSTIAHQATKTQAHGLFLERETTGFFTSRVVVSKGLERGECSSEHSALVKIHILGILALQATKDSTCSFQEVSYSCVLVGLQASTACIHV